MRRCHRCDRHVFEVSTRCPFCGAAHRVAASPVPVLGVLLGLALASCSDRPTDDEGAGSGGATTSTTGQTTTASGSGPITSTDDTSTATDVATTAMTATATDDGATGTTGTTGTTGPTTGTTTGPGDDTVTVPPYGGAFPDDDESASTTGEPGP